ncbi:hypothetical protein, partial [Francisella tularensis]|uniref:hypothetical protein n=1 Tax=Francisella tularensis TaxID=263 RepID=UPI003877E0E6
STCDIFCIGRCVLKTVANLSATCLLDLDSTTTPFSSSTTISVQAPAVCAITTHFEAIAARAGKPKPSLWLAQATISKVIHTICISLLSALNSIKNNGISNTS